MSTTGYCRGRFNVTSVIIVLVFSALGYFIYSESSTGGYTQWSSWAECSKSCGEGIRGRTRKCTAPKPGIIGKDCQGPPLVTEKCSLISHCPIDGGFTEWSASGYGAWSSWTECSKSCGEGLRGRTRNCTAPKPGCPGPPYVTEKCSVISHCPIDGGFTEWSGYGACDKTCGGGIRVRIRRCTNPAPEYGGKPCEGSGFEKKNCSNTQPCPVNGGYSAWGAYSKCEITGNKNCGKGKHVRTRTCNNPVPQHGGKACEGPDSETGECEIPCPTTPPLNTTSSPLNTISTNYSTLANT